MENKLYEIMVVSGLDKEEFEEICENVFHCMAQNYADGKKLYLGLLDTGDDFDLINDIYQAHTAFFSSDILLDGLYRARNPYAKEFCDKWVFNFDENGGAI